MNALILVQFLVLLPAMLGVVWLSTRPKYRGCTWPSVSVAVLQLVNVLIAIIVIANVLNGAST